MDHHKALIQRRDTFGGERVGGVHRRHALEVDMGAGKLRRQVVDVIFHGTHHRVHHCLARVAALAHVTRQLLDPLQVDDWDHADQQIHVARHVVLRRNHATV